MSQAKVDKYKKEKKNREKNIKKKKIQKAVVVIVFAGVVGAAIGVPLGKQMYLNDVAKRKANATVTAGLFNSWFDEYWVTNGYSDRVGFPTSDDINDLLGTDTDADYNDSATSDSDVASDTDAR